MIDFQKAFKIGRPFFQKVARKVLKTQREIPLPPILLHIVNVRWLEKLRQTR